MKKDNQGSIALAHKSVFHVHPKYINIQYHYIQDKVAVGRIKLFYIPTSKMIANKMTKPFT